MKDYVRIYQERKLELLKRQEQIQKDLPHLYGWPWYQWAWEFFNNTKDDVQLLCAANQISKSSTQIRKCIDWATNKDKWEGLWGREPNMFWYLYPSKDVATAEFEKKWVPEFMPRGEMKTDAVYGWDAQYDKRFIKQINFRSGVSIYFKTYMQDSHTLQSGSVYSIFCFTKDHLIETKDGLLPIQDIKAGVDVLTREGAYEKVVTNYSREAGVITRYLSNGLKLEGTPDHRVWTKNSGYVELQHLTSKDVLDVSPSWQKKKQLSLKEKSTQDTLSRKTRGTTILQSLTEEADPIYTRLFGKSTGVKFQKVVSYITKMRILLIIKFLIWSLLQGLSTQESTNSMSGEMGRLVSIKKKFVNSVKKVLRLALLRKQQEIIVLKDVEKKPTLKLDHVITALKNLALGRTPQDTFVLDSVALYTKKQKVYNINVKNVHNYYLSGVNLSNCDEELPENLYDELQFRTAGTAGFFHMVFTATLGQEMWWRAMEARGTDQEFLKDAWKRTVSMYDCLKYADGNLSPWTLERIKKVEAKCKSKNEIKRRVWGRFVKEEGRTIHQFDPTRHYVEPFEIPKHWPRYAAVDIGSGGETGHPSAIVFIAVQPDFKKGWIYKAWRGDGIPTTSGDVYAKFKEMQGKHEIFQKKVYDYAAKDFGTITARLGESFEKANKSHELGEDLLNTLFKNDMFFLFDGDDEIRKLGSEYISLQKATPKNKAKDDLTDTSRYGVVEVPFDFDDIKAGSDEDDVDQGAKMPQTKQAWEDYHLAQRRGIFEDGNSANDPQDWHDLENDFEEWNEQYGN